MLFFRVEIEWIFVCTGVPRSCKSKVQFHWNLAPKKVLPMAARLLSLTPGKIMKD